MWTPCDVPRFDSRAKRLANCEVPIRRDRRRPRAILSASAVIAHAGLLAHLVHRVPDCPVDAFHRQRKVNAEKQQVIDARRNANCRYDLSRRQQKEATMKLTTIALTTAVALAGTSAFAQSSGGSAGGSSQAGGSAGSQTTTGSSMSGSTTDGMNNGAAVNNGTTGTAMGSGSVPASGDASNSGAPTAAGANSEGSRTEPGAVKNGSNGR